jgi:LmbE family N-acetylglucosaminyl deacetylase
MRKISEILDGFLALPEPDLDTVLGNKRALILAPHPDDESLGCGGLIAGSCAAGRLPSVVFLTNGAGSHPGSISHPPAYLQNIRASEAHSAAKALGLDEKNLFFLRYQDGLLPSSGAAFSAAVARIQDIGIAQGCGIIIGPWQGDPHCDHEAGAVMASAVALKAGWPLLSYPVWGWLRKRDEIFDEPRRQGWRLNITCQHRRKQDAIAAHASQHGRIIKDSPNGFTIPENLLDISARNFEVFIA